MYFFINIFIWKYAKIFLLLLLLLPVLLGWWPLPTPITPPVSAIGAIGPNSTDNYS